MKIMNQNWFIYFVESEDGVEIYYKDYRGKLEL